MRPQAHVRLITTPLDRVLAGPMFVVTLLFLACFASFLYLRDTEFWGTYRGYFMLALLALYPLYPLEFLWHWWRGSRFLGQHWFFCLLPMTRLGGRDHITGRHVWLPRRGWLRADKQLAMGLIKTFSVPMILIALLVLPVVLIELFYADALARKPWFRLAIDTASAFIWSAFVLEFVLVMSVTRNRWRYVRQNWIDVAVILLPLLDFLRIPQLGQVLALKQLTRTARLYRLRGLVIRAWRAVLTLKMIDKVILRDPAIRLDRRRQLLMEMQEEVARLQLEIRQLEVLLEARQRRDLERRRQSHRPPVDDSSPEAVANRMAATIFLSKAKPHSSASQSRRPPVRESAQRISPDESDPKSV